MARKKKTEEVVVEGGAVVTGEAATTLTPATDAFWVDPTTVRRGYNSRVLAEVDEAEGDILGAIDIHNAGQQQACVARRTNDGAVELVAGFGRLRKVLKLREGFDHNGARYHKPDLQLLVRIDASIENDKDAFIASVRENVRKEVSPLNIAKQQDVLRKDFKLKDGEIAAIYGYNNTNATARYKKLLSAPDEVQLLVHAGELSTDAALKLLELPKAKQKELLDRVAAGEKLTGSIVAEFINAYLEEKEAKAAAKGEAGSGGGEGGEGEGEGGAAGDSSDDAAPKKQARNAAKLKKWIDAYVNREFDGVPLDETAPLACQFANAIVKYLDGVGGDQKLWNAFNKLVENEAK